jgi:predicted ThiF/HesA family dinucleotide-utilizing enzyme
MKKKDKKLNKKAAKKAKKAKKNGKFNVIDTVKDTVKNINKDAVIDFAKKNAKILIAIGSTVAVLGAAKIAKKAKKRK